MVFTCSERLVAELPRVLGEVGVSVAAWDRRDGGGSGFLWSEGREELVVRVLEKEEAYPGVVRVVLELPVVVRDTGFVRKVMGILRAHGAREGAPDGFRCGCGYCLFGNTTGRCPECGAGVAG